MILFFIFFFVIKVNIYQYGENDELLCGKIDKANIDSIFTFISIPHLLAKFT